MRTAAARPLAGHPRLRGRTPIVSSDIVGSSFSGTFDADATMVLGEQLSKTLSWFDNGWGYAHRARRADRAASGPLGRGGRA